MMEVLDGELGVLVVVGVLFNKFLLELLTDFGMAWTFFISWKGIMAGKE